MQGARLTYIDDHPIILLGLREVFIIVTRPIVLTIFFLVLVKLWEARSQQEV